MFLCKIVTLEVKAELDHFKQDIRAMDPKQVAANLHDKLKRDNLQEDDLIYILEKLKAPLVLVCSFYLTSNPSNEKND